MQAMCGVINSTGFPDQPPVKSGAAICDFMAGIHLYGAIMTALYERERTGKGRVVEVSMQDATYASLASNLGMLHARGADAPARTGNRHGGLGISPYNVYRTSDGYVVLNAPGDHHFRSILDVMGRSDLKEDPRFVSRARRVAHFADVDELIESWTKTLTKNDVARRMLAAKVPCAPVRDLSEVMHDENMHARGSLQWIDHPTLGRVVAAALAARVRGDPAPADRAQPARWAPATTKSSANGSVIRRRSWRLMQAEGVIGHPEEESRARQAGGRPPEQAGAFVRDGG